MAEEKNLLLDAEKEDARSYKLSLWWVEHRGFLRRLGYGLLIAFDAILLLFVAWTFLDTYAISYGQEQNAVARVVAVGQSDLHAYTVANAASAIFEEDVRVFSVGSNRYNFYAHVVNPNLDWWAEFTFLFSFSTGETEERTGFLLPGQEKPILELAVLNDSPVRVAEFELTDVAWHRVDHHAIGDYQTWIEKRNNLQITDATFNKEPLNDKIIGVSNFTVFNNTAYSYYSPKFIVLLMKGSNVAGVSQITVGSIDSLETKNVSLNWFGTLPGVTKIEVISDFHFLDPSIYKPLKSEFGGDVRTRAGG